MKLHNFFLQSLRTIPAILLKMGEPPVVTRPKLVFRTHELTLPCTKLCPAW